MTHGVRVRADARLCRDCQACALACSLLHEGECHLGLAGLRVAKDMARYEFQIRICQHCRSPECVPVCPTEAIRMDERGVVLIHDDECSRCGACASSCPYQAIFHHEAADRYLKCDLCAGREQGALCVEVCPVGALTQSPAPAGVEV